MTESLLLPPIHLNASGSGSTISDQSSNFSNVTSASFVRRVSFDTISASCPSPKEPSSRRGSVSNNDGNGQSHFTSSGYSYTDKELPTLPSKRPLSSILSFSNTSFGHYVNSNSNYSGQRETTKDFNTVSVSARHKSFLTTSLSRTFLIIFGDSSQHNLNTAGWLVQNLAEDGDEVVCMQHYLGLTNESTTELPSPADAQLILGKLLELIKPHRKICISVELAIGKVRDVACQILQMYKPCLIAISSDNKQQWLHLRNRNISLADYIAPRCMLPLIVVTAKNVENYLEGQQQEQPLDQPLDPIKSKSVKPRRPISVIYPIMLPKQEEPSNISRVYALPPSPPTSPHKIPGTRRYSLVPKISSFKDLRARRRSIS